MSSSKSGRRALSQALAFRVPIAHPSARTPYQPPGRRRKRRRAAAVIAVTALAVTALVTAPAASASASTGYIGNRILNIEESKANHYYSYGAAGPVYFDCSGLVYWAASAAGERNWPRDTYGIASEIGTRFSLTSHPQRGDLAMWGPVGAPYHVEMVTIWNGITFGAETYGWDGRVYWHSNGWFRPSFYLHINW